MKPISKVAVAAVTAILASVAGQGTCHAGEPAKADAAILSQLAGTAIPTAQLGQMRGEGGVALSLNDGQVSGNSVGPNSVTGSNSIASNSVSNNSGITTVFQNTGNNALLQNSTSIYISVH